MRIYCPCCTVYIISLSIILLNEKHISDFRSTGYFLYKSSNSHHNRREHNYKETGKSNRTKQSLSASTLVPDAFSYCNLLKETWCIGSTPFPSFFPFHCYFKHHKQSSSCSLRYKTQDRLSTLSFLRWDRILGQSKSNKVMKFLCCIPMSGEKVSNVFVY